MTYMKTIILGLIPLLMLVMPTISYAMTPAQDGREQGITDAFANAHDAGAPCSKYQTNINDNNTEATNVIMPMTWRLTKRVWHILH